ncbi:MAG: MBL fold metallo-hydrolase [Gammaproteobacteria bacterium]|nr:MBL fold metallo-hydrolase [Gammaproteobacteria bacterium]
MTQQLPAELAQIKPATKFTQAANRAVTNELDFDDTTSFECAARGFIATLDPLTITRERDGKVTYDLSAPIGFLDSDAPDTVNPSLWRQAQLNAQHNGLYEVVDGIYQVRSFDIANMTLVRGDTGWIVIDPLTSSESSRAALDLANRHLGERPVVAVIHTHSHADHFAGVLGVIDPADAESGKIPVLAPDGYVQESLNENVLAGNVMNRRATYMYGNLLTPSPRGFVTAGLGAALSMGTTGFVVPNDIVERTGETRTFDGIEIEFQMTPGTEAPAEMVFFFPQFNALCMSEITSHHLHNVYTPRGAQIRDALAWAAQINESIERYGARMEVQFASHHWPIWGRSEALEYLAKQRDLYKYIHDQSLRLANHGYTKDEIAEQLTLPRALAKEFYNRDYYGTVHHNARAVYVKYLGYFDGNPAHLYPLPGVDAGRRYVEFMGGADAVVDKAQDSFDAGDYRWVAEVLNHVVMAEPGHEDARALLADTLEQLGYQSESAPWRNFFLTGTQELRAGVQPASASGITEGMARGMPLDNLFQAMAVRLNGTAAEGLSMFFNLDFNDLDLPYLLAIENSVLHAFEGKVHPEPTATVNISSHNFKRLMLGLVDATLLLAEGDLIVEGDMRALGRLGSLFDQFDRRFPIMFPRPLPDSAPPP